MIRSLRLAVPCSFLMPGPVDANTLFRLRQFRNAVSLASIAYIFSAIHAIQFSLRNLNTDYNSDSDSDMDTGNTEDPSHSQDASRSEFTPTFSNPADVSTSNPGKATAGGSWTDQEISLLLDYVEANCPLTTSRGFSLKKSHFNKARETVKSKDASQCHYKWGHVGNYVDYVVYLIDLI